MNRKDRFRLVWSDDLALGRRLVEVACRGTTQQLEDLLATARRKGELTAVESSSVPHWLDETGDVKEIFRRPAIFSELREIVSRMAASAWHGGALMTVSAPVDRMDLRMTARVAARTSVFAAGEVVTVVFFQLEDEPTPVGVDACLRALVEGYAGFSNDDTWRRTRWFARMGRGPVQEL